MVQSVSLGTPVVFLLERAGVRVELPLTTIWKTPWRSLLVADMILGLRRQCPVLRSPIAVEGGLEFLLGVANRMSTEIDPISRKRMRDVFAQLSALALQRQEGEQQELAE